MFFVVLLQEKLRLGIQPSEHRSRVHITDRKIEHIIHDRVCISHGGLTQQWKIEKCFFVALLQEKFRLGIQPSEHDIEVESITQIEK